MNTPVLRASVSLLTPVLLLVSWALLLRGHHEPGGGFVGGLVAGAAVAFVALVRGEPFARGRLPLSPLRLAGLGLAVALATGAIAVATGAPFLSGIWTSAPDSVLGTPLVFDLGVYLVVLGVSSAILLELLREDT